MPPSADPMVWRVLTSPKLHGSVTMRDLGETMSMHDLVEANDVVTSLDNAEALARKGV